MRDAHKRRCAKRCYLTLHLDVKGSRLASRIRTTQDPKQTADPGLERFRAMYQDTVRRHDTHES